MGGGDLLLLLLLLRLRLLLANDEAGEDEATTIPPRDSSPGLRKGLLRLPEEPGCIDLSKTLQTTETKPKKCISDRLN